MHTETVDAPPDAETIDAPAKTTLAAEATALTAGEQRVGFPGLGRCEQQQVVVAFPPKRDIQAPRHDSERTGQAPHALRSDTKVPMFRGDSVGRAEGDVG
jgi:hypothetical protein